MFHKPPRCQHGHTHTLPKSPCAAGTWLSLRKVTHARWCKWDFSDAKARFVLSLPPAHKSNRHRPSRYANNGICEMNAPITMNKAESSKTNQSENSQQKKHVHQGAYSPTRTT